MVFARACLGLAVVRVSAQDPMMPDPFQPPGDLFQGQQLLDQLIYQQPLGELPTMGYFQGADDGSAACQAKQSENPFHQGMSKLAVGGVYCGQAADSRWWDVTVQTQNCDGSYSVVVKDEVATTWPVAQRAYFLDMACDEFYREALRAEGLSEQEIANALPSQSHSQNHADGLTYFAGDTTPQQQPQPVEITPVTPPKTSRWPTASDKKMPWKVVAGAAAAGAVPVIYGLTGS